ncbi:hypothetical protein BV20DRAFT_954876 [Pilatotrama ljubarskyi]|nr:hypothetical protein BV20DRAFT_954876 [Pilatotrama ljubarskyi]
MVEDGDLWFRDGDVILHARAAGVSVAFRIYRDMLERESKVFADIFARSLPRARRTAEGCPIIDLHEEPADVKVLLLVLFDGKDLYHDNDAPISVDFAQLSALIRMGHKYAIQDILEDGIARLKKYYPSDFDTWEDVLTRTSYVNSGAANAPQVVALSRLTDTPSLLPGAFLDCCSTTTLVDTVLGEAGGDDSPCAYTNMLSQLEREDVGRVIAGKAELTHARALRMFALLRSVPCEFCHRPERCALATQRTLQEYELSELKEATRGQHLFSPLHEWFWDGAENARLCGPCDATSMQLDNRMRIEAWCMLPKVFDVCVEGWPETWQAAVGIE